MRALDASFPFSGANLLVTVDAVKCWTNQVRSRPAVSWSPLPSDSFKWNVDGSSIGKPGRSGICGVLRDSFGNIICLFSCFVGIIDSNAAELLVISKALEVSVNLMNAVSWFHNLESAPWRFSSVANSIIECKSHLPALLVKHIPREANAFADNLAKQGVFHYDNFIVFL
ncbi:hypothetical protein P3X46_000329 [Hevea brasiliensis]|uniref:RNase H type-1 domain-containing protein n=1 Tax=Hevea brasiliensis TaxID=3981 RepID=A0ABQ9NAM1_HEVBR|nr:uncharacterized protein LOC131183761 [Hevea brasiliensis]KAJ9188985.1 hypothetical protein P3X46_000329 [Hevea brasiliensis]